jgi:hypothetical protein
MTKNSDNPIQVSTYNIEEEKKNRIEIENIFMKSLHIHEINTVFAFPSIISFFFFFLHYKLFVLRIMSLKGTQEYMGRSLELGYCSKIAVS